MARALAQGLSVPRDDWEAVRFYRLAAASGNPGARNELALLISDGRGAPRDDAEATRLWRQAAEQGLADAQYNLARAYQTGRGIGQDDGEAVRWFERAAGAGHTPALNALGGIYEDGAGAPQDLPLAAALYRRASNLGMPAAQYNLAVLLLAGRGVPQNQPEGLALLRRAADRGYAPAQNSLGIELRDGVATARDAVAASRFFRRAAEQGLAAAQLNLGRAYERGEGVAADRLEAELWYRRASDQGLPQAASALSRLVEMPTEGGRASEPSREEQPSSGSVAAPAGTDREAIFWQSIAASTNPRDFEAYLQRFPDGLFAPLARNRIGVLTRPVVAPGTGGPNLSAQRDPTAEPRSAPSPATTPPARTPLADAASGIDRSRAQPGENEVRDQQRLPPSPPPPPPRTQMTSNELQNLPRDVQRDHPTSQLPRPAAAPVGPGRPDQANTQDNPSAAGPRGDIEAITRHIARFWTVPIGAPGAENLIVDLHLVLRINGGVRDVQVEDQARYRSDPTFRAAADSAMRAARLASPLPLPTGRAEQFRDLIIRFDPHRVMGLGG